jgi:6-phosphogluconolactonase
MSGQVAVFVGTYTEPSYRGKGEGIYSFNMSVETGALEPPRRAAGAVNPAYIALDPARRHLYCVNELKEFEGRASGAVTAFSIDPRTRGLTRLNAQATEGADPCHVVVSRDARHVLVSNYASGSVSVLPIARDGSLGKAVQVVRHRGSSVDGNRQAGPHAHSALFDPAQRYAFVCDLGLDRLLAYRYDGNAREPLSAAESLGLSVKPGAGPRHCAFHPSGDYCYLVNELDSTVEVMRYQPELGSLARLQSASTLPEGGCAANSGAAIRVSPNGKFLYASNRGHDSVVVYRISEATGLLAYVGFEPSGGRTPRDFAIDPTGNFLLVANQDSDNVAVFRVDAESGRLSKISETELPTPVCVIAQTLDEEPAL